MKLLAALPLIVLSGLALAQTKEKTMVLSWGDVIWQHRGEGVSQLDTPEKMRQAVRIWKKEGIQKVQFRLDSFRILLFHHLYVPADNPYVTDYHRGWSRMTRRAWDEGIVQTALEALKAEHIQVYGYFTIFDEGSPPETVPAGTGFWPWQSKFTRENLHFLSCDRSLSVNERKYHWGVMEYAYPEVRKYMIDQVRSFTDRFDFDGVFLSTRSHSVPAEHADQFGFNRPVVEEYQRRYGRDILRQTFDLEKWRELRGEYFTTFLRELKEQLETRGQALAIGVPQATIWDLPSATCDSSGGSGLRRESLTNSQWAISPTNVRAIRDGPRGPWGISRARRRVSVYRLSNRR